jgi:4-hydroxyphenylpyruvate dioxygenase
MHVQEHNPEPSNPLGMDGIEFIEFATSQPQALGGLLQKMGFVPVARHRSREVMLYRQGAMNLIVNAHADVLPGMSAPGDLRSRQCISRARRGLRLARARPGVGDADPRLRDGLNIPGIPRRQSHLFVDRYHDFSSTMSISCRCRA